MSTVSASLNSGAELDDTPPELFDNPTPGEVPDFDQEISVISSLRVAAEALADVFSDIKRAGGMNLTFAMEAERILPNTLSKPMGYYTKSTSATLLKESMEGITTGIWALIGAGIAAVLALVYKLVKWLTGSKSDKTDVTDADGRAARDNFEKKAKAVPEAQEAAMDAVKEMRVLNNDMRHNPIEFKTQSGHVIRYNNMDDAIAELFTDDEKYGRAKRFLDNPNPIHQDIVAEGPYTQFFYKVVDNQLFHNVHDALNLKISELEAIRKEDAEAQGSLLVQLYSRLDQLTKPIMVGYQGADITLSELVDKMRAARSGAAHKEVKRNLHFDHLFNTIESSLKRKDLARTLHDVSTGLGIVVDMKKALKKTSDLLGDLSVDGSPGASTEGIAVRLRAAIPALGHDIAAFGQLIHQVDQFANDYMFLVREVVGFSTMIVAKISRDMERSGAEVSQEWKNLMKDRSKKLEEIERNLYGNVFRLNNN